MEPIAAVSWNIEQSQWDEEKASLAEEQLEAIATGDAKPDVICLQEVTDLSTIKKSLPGYRVHRNGSTAVCLSKTRFSCLLELRNLPNITAVFVEDEMTRKVKVITSAFFGSKTDQLLVPAPLGSIGWKDASITANAEVLDTLGKLCETVKNLYSCEMSIVGASWDPATSTKEISHAFESRKHGWIADHVPTYKDQAHCTDLFAMNIHKGQKRPLVFDKKVVGPNTDVSNHRFVKGTVTGLPIPLNSQPRLA